MSNIDNRELKSKTYILGIRVNNVSKDRLLTAIEKRIIQKKNFYIVTPNPELVLASTKNKQLKDALNGADFAIPDGVGLKVAKSSLKIIKGRELFLDLITLAKKKNWRVFLLGGLDNEAEIVARKFHAQYAGGREITINLSKDIVDKINKFAPHFLFVAFGNPKQEIFMYENVKKLNAKCMMAVGGTFRYITGFSKLPPKWMEGLGLEWLWRLFTEPFRLRRVWNAVVVFPVKVWLWKLSSLNS